MDDLKKYYKQEEKDLDDKLQELDNKLQELFDTQEILETPRDSYLVIRISTCFRECSGMLIVWDKKGNRARELFTVKRGSPRIFTFNEGLVDSYAYAYTNPETGGSVYGGPYKAPSSGVLDISWCQT